MADRPLLSLPTPTRNTPRGRQAVIKDAVRPAGAERQGQRLGPKFQRLSEVLPDPQRLAELRNDPTAIAPERALVFEIASEVIDFDRARRNVPGLEFLGEDQDEVPSDENFIIEGKPDKPIRRRIYFTMPDATALREIVSLWNRYQRGEALERGRTEWRKVFDHLSDIRPWGPKDRVTEEAKADWLNRLEQAPDNPVRFEVEYWYQTNPTKIEAAHQRLRRTVLEAGGNILDESRIEKIRYDAALLEVAPGYIRQILDNPDLGLAAFDEVMVLRPQSLVSDAQEVSFEDASDAVELDIPEPTEPPMAALLDGLPMSQHAKLENRLSIDDPDNYEAQYGRATEQRHGTSMASLIIHGDLNAPVPSAPVRSRVYVRPVMYPQTAGFNGEREERMPPNKLAIDVIWRSFLRMFVGEGGEDPAAPSVKVVNLSLGDLNRRFSGVLSPWARLIDYLSWEYGVLILVSAGNIPDPIPLDGLAAWADFEAASPEEREAILIRAILKQRASRRLLAPSEGVNALTVGACHSDTIAPHGAGPLAIDPYVSPSLPNLSSALGLGYLRGVKPEILLPGGREHIRSSASHAPITVSPVKLPGRFFGIAAASPSADGDLAKQMNVSGTSVATALATHSALKLLEAIQDIPNDPPYPVVDEAFHAVILKTLLVHAAKWDGQLAERIARLSREAGTTHWEHQREDATRFLGFGMLDLAKVLECTERRATMIGWNTIHANETDQFRIPLPPQLENIAGFRAVTATAGWFTPIKTEHRMYRMAKFEIGPGGDEGLSLGVDNSKQQPSHHAFGRGTVYHRRWEGADGHAFVDNGDLVLEVTCKPAAGDLDDAIPYGLAVSIEVGDGVAVPVYDEIRARLRQVIGVPVRA
ncbi:MAG: S8 family peptidase [Novosphingobium sp.]|uniref:S8 family peptidase n=1 Tax=Novosphingobium sp. TaxID=1874826 RepID=UPI0022C899AC|nr:S8 family peptidase [Novosphingobium sp.]MCZ8036314.1 S8 family peptidase [Novosphingobium sp.]